MNPQKITKFCQSGEMSPNLVALAQNFQTFRPLTLSNTSFEFFNRKHFIVFEDWHLGSLVKRLCLYNNKKRFSKNGLRVVPMKIPLDGVVSTALLLSYPPSVTRLGDLQCFC